MIVECMAYYTPDIKFNLFSPQSFLLKEKGKGEFKINEDGISFALNSHDSLRISLSSANLPVAYVSHANALGENQENQALFTCATDSRNINLPQKSKRLLQWHYRLGHCSMKLVRWLSSKGVIKGEIDASSHVLCDSCRLARGSKRPTLYPGASDCVHDRGGRKWLSRDAVTCPGIQGGKRPVDIWSLEIISRN